MLVLVSVLVLVLDNAAIDATSMVQELVQEVGAASALRRLEELEELEELEKLEKLETLEELEETEKSADSWLRAPYKDSVAVVRVMMISLRKRVVCVSRGHLARGHTELRRHKAAAIAPLYRWLTESKLRKSVEFAA